MYLLNLNQINRHKANKTLQHQVLFYLCQRPKHFDREQTKSWSCNYLTLIYLCSIINI